MNKVLRFAAASLCVLSFASCDINSILDKATQTVGLSDSDVVSGLQEALVLGSKTAALQLSDTSLPVGGYLKNELVKIVVPDTIEQYFDEVDNLVASASKYMSSLQSDPRMLGKMSASQQLAFEQASLQLADLSSISNAMKPYKQKIVTAMNRGAEQAAPNSIGVFKTAITNLTFDDARGLLSSTDTTAVTGFLKVKTFDGLNVAFKPILKEPLDLLNPNQYWTPAAKYYNDFVGTYATFKNTLNFTVGASALPSPKYSSAPTDLSDFLSTYATGKALSGLFYMVGVQEGKLRADPWGALKAVGSMVSSTVSDLIGKVFEEAGS